MYAITFLIGAIWNFLKESIIEDKDGRSDRRSNNNNRNNGNNKKPQKQSKLFMLIIMLVVLNLLFVYYKLDEKPKEMPGYVDYKNYHNDYLARSLYDHISNICENDTTCILNTYKDESKNLFINYNYFLILNPNTIVEEPSLIDEEKVCTDFILDNEQID